MRANKLRAAVEANQAQLGVWINMSRNPAVLTLYQAAGLDFARMDVEHSSPSMETVADMAVMARALDFPLAVRPPVANREWITRLLDVGVYNLHCPQVIGAQHAAEIVAASFYAPLGLRGYGGIGPGNDFDSSGTDAERRRFANQQVFVTVMLETADAFRELDDIAAMPGIHALTIGPADLAQDLGVRDTADESKALDEKRHLILEACRKHGKVFANMAASPEDARKWKEAGALVLLYGSDTSLLHAGIRDVVKRYKG